MREHIIARTATSDLLERGARLLQIGQNEFFRQRAALCFKGAARARHRFVGDSHETRVPHVAHPGPIRERLHVARPRNFTAKRLEAGARGGRD